MADEQNSAPETERTALPDGSLIPTDFREYERWRSQGDSSAAGEEKESSAAAQEQPGKTGSGAQAKTAPDSEPEVNAEPSSDADEESEDPAELRRLRAGSRQRRIDRLTKENQELLARLEKAEGRPPATASPPPPAELPPGEKPKPVMKDFKTIEEWAMALGNWQREQWKAEEKADQEKKDREKAVKDQQETWVTRGQAFSKSHPDYDEVLSSVTVPNGAAMPDIQRALYKLENGPAVLYKLAKQPEELKRIAALDPYQAVMELGKLAASLDVPANGKPKVSGAPPPPSRMSRPTGQTAADDPMDEELAKTDFPRWRKAREAQLNLKR